MGHAGTTGALILPVGTYEVGELASTDTDLDDYDAAIECRDQGGSGAVVFSGADSGPLEVTINTDDDIVCTIINTRLFHPGITVEKAPDLETVTRGGDVLFSIRVTNTGDAVLYDIQIDDALAPVCDRDVTRLGCGR